LIGSYLEDIKVVLPEAPAKLDPFTLFEPKPAEIWLEIGFGGGEHLAAQAAANPDIGFIGCEPFLNGVSSLLLHLDQGGQKNVRVLSEDARVLLLAMLENTIARAFLLFPDPWPKRRHEDRRFVTPQGLDLLAAVLKDEAEFRIATDHPILRPWVLEYMEAHPAFRLSARFEDRPDDWPPTRYEAKAIAAGRSRTYLSYIRLSRG
jgi:tRNA (guanine-N7-)-methyltransferase